MQKTPKYDIILKDVFFSYGDNPVLENVNLKINHGTFSSIVGPNGGGKTTLLKLVLGQIRPDKGKIELFGCSPEKARTSVGYMPQFSSLDLDFPVSVMDVVLMGRLGKKIFGWYSAKDKKAAEKALSEVQLENFAKVSFSKLSGGQRQRVLIARALCCEPELLLLDEPTSNVDPEAEENLFSILKELNKRMTILIVSHDLGFVSQIVESVICVNRRVLVHPTSKINGELIKEIYGGELKMVRHDHRCSEEGHFHD
jgi:zinc transport system ATP-binding protein